MQQHCIFSLSPLYDDTNLTMMVKLLNIQTMKATMSLGAEIPKETSPYAVSSRRKPQAVSQHYV